MGTQFDDDALMIIATDEVWEHFTDDKHAKALRGKSLWWYEATRDLWATSIAVGKDVVQVDASAESGGEGQDDGDDDIPPRTPVRPDLKKKGL
jgi:hypothetical protein